MIRLRLVERILEETQINFVKNEDEKNHIRYLSLIKVDEHDSVPFEIEIYKDHNFLNINSLPILFIEDKDMQKALKLLNDINVDLIYGKFYITDNKIYYSYGISLEGDLQYITKDQFFDYLLYMIKKTSDLLRALNEENIYSCDTQEINEKDSIDEYFNNR